MLVTHNVREAVCLGDRVVLLSPNPGRIHEVFDISLPRPRDINGPELSEYASRITAALKSYYVPEDGAMKRAVIASLFFAALVGAWQAMVMSGRWSPVLLPSPASVGEYLWSVAR